ncbi:hypothetical protein J6590_011294 [Homalodisca vitripennis]|nr:hypothetical protein J6590_011294 [Homalodisca vitripennis]
MKANLESAGYTYFFQKRNGYGGYRERTVERVSLLLGWVTDERSCPINAPVGGGGSEVTSKPLVPRLSVREGFLAVTSPGKIRHF